MKRALVVVSKMDTGGAETMMMKYYRALDKTKYQLDFAVSTDEEGFYDAEIKSLGGRIIRVTKKSSNPVKAMADIYRIARSGTYCCVIRNAENAMASLDLLVARLGGVGNTVFRSTNSNTSGKSAFERLSHILGMPILKIATKRMVAPSGVAARFMFGDKAVREGRYTLLPNAIAFEDYAFDADKRRILRDEHHISENTLMLGTVGRMVEQKNQAYSLDVLKELSNRGINARLFLVGKGDKRQALEDKAQADGIFSKVTFLPPTPQVASLYSMFDVLLLPSFFEGMPNVLIEAQASGLTCITSDKVTPEAKLLDSTRYLPITQDAVSDWADACSAPNGTEDRLSIGRAILNSPFNMHEAVKTFVAVVFGDGQTARR
ncbi:glycosyltransferase family 1 protein [Bifidobacterium callitrichos]|uniref:Glycosyltransferase family 1 protein n=1 Tax=Bifidobacterium callitrichos TaxID=762209 RepID=A0A5M9Z9H2_9BIFI|nr:glycosyltransferase [Bifidobacterium callitrichos]KAA8815152.1 glycosyltransferase family 1 protein [Bifidobacterium callitrichos]